MVPVPFESRARFPLPRGLRLETDPAGLILARGGLVRDGGLLLSAFIFVVPWKLGRHDRTKGWLFMLWLITLAGTSRRSRHRETVPA